MPRTPRKQPPPPLEVHAVYTAITGTAIWAIITIGLALFGRNWLEDTDREWWLLSALAGTVIGMIGIPICARRTRKGPPGSHEAAVSKEA